MIDPSDPRVIRIAEALAEGCDGRSFASDDAKLLYRKYQAWKDRDLSISFSECKHRAFADFIAEVLNGGES